MLESSDESSGAASGTSKASRSRKSTGRSSKGKKSARSKASSGKKELKGLSLEGEKDCEDCGANSQDDADPLRKLAQETDPSLPDMPIRWGRPRKAIKGKVYTEGRVCYYCRRTKRAKAKWRKMKKKQFRQTIDANGDGENAEKKQFLKDRGVTVMVLHEKGDKVQVREGDYNNPIYVDMVEEIGEKTYRAGTKMREDVYLLRYTPEQRKKLNVKKETKYNRKDGKIETFYRIFDDVDGVERFEFYESNAAQKRQTLHDDEVGDYSEAEHAFNDAAEDFNMGQHKSTCTKLDAGYVEQKQSKFEGDNKKNKKLTRCESNASSSTCSSSTTNFRAVNKKILKAKTNAKKGARKPSSSAASSVDTPRGKPRAGTANSSPSGKQPVEASTISGFELDRPTAGKDKNFVRQLDLKLREGCVLNTTFEKVDDLANLNEDEFTQAIRTNCGGEQKVLQCGFLKCKARDLRFCVCIAQAASKSMNSFLHAFTPPFRIQIE